MSFPLMDVEWGQLFQLNTALLRSTPSRKISARVLPSYLKLVTCMSQQNRLKFKLRPVCVHKLLILAEFGSVFSCQQNINKDLISQGRLNWLFSLFKQKHHQIELNRLRQLLEKEQHCNKTDTFLSPDYNRRCNQPRLLTKIRLRHRDCRGQKVINRHRKNAGQRTSQNSRWRLRT